MSPGAPRAHLLRRQAARRDTGGRQSGPLGVIYWVREREPPAGRTFARTARDLRSCSFAGSAYRIACGLPGRCANRRDARWPCSPPAAQMQGSRTSGNPRPADERAMFHLAGSAQRLGRLMTGLERDEDVVLSFVAVAFTGEAVAIAGKVAMTAAFVGLWAAVAGIVRVLLVVGLVAARSARWWVPPASCWWAPLRRVGATGSPLAGHRASPWVAAEVTRWFNVVPWFNVVNVRGALRPGWTRARKVPRRFVRWLGEGNRSPEGGCPGRLTKVDLDIGIRPVRSDRDS